MAETRLNGLLRHLHSGMGVTPVALPSDREALRAFTTTRDESAFAALVHRHGPMVMRVCQRVLHHTQDAEDSFQATFLILARKADTIGRSEALASWLHGVAFRTSLRARRDAGRRRVRERQAPVAVGADPSDALAWSDVQLLLETEVHRLPERLRAAFVLCHLDGRSRAEAAAELGVAENTLSSRLARARDRLRQRLARRGVHLPAALAAIALTTSATGFAIAPELTSITARAGVAFAAGQPLTGTSTFTLQLTSAEMQSMAIAKLKWVVGVLAVGGALAVGAWGAGQGPGERPSAGGGSPPTPDAREEKPAAIERTADYAQRQRSLKNLKLIAAAMINYQDATGRFPADITDRDGKPILSWRVELLPFLDQGGLYSQFKRTEPWDSEQNLKLLAKMPDVFRVGFEPKEATHTYYQRFAIAGGLWGIILDGSGSIAGAAGPGRSGPGSATGPPTGGGPTAPSVGAVTAPAVDAPRFPLRMAEVSDGTANTLGVVEAGPPVPWSKPADVVYDARKPLPLLAGPFTNVRNVATLDGAVHALRPKLDETIMRHLIEPNDGNVLPDWKTLHARFPADSDEEKKALARLLEDNRAMIAALEEQIREHAALLVLTNQVTKDVERAEEEQEQLKNLLQIYKVKNRKLRDELGLGSTAPLPRKQ